MSRVVVARERGGPEVLRLEDQQVAAPGAKQCKVRVHAAGVAFGDVMRRRGLLTPPGALTPGYDIAGEVVDGELPAGTRVAAMMPNPGHGGYAEEIVFDTARLVRVPDAVDAVTAVALGLNYITAWQLLTRMSTPAEGDVVLVHGASGGVGTALLELCALRGIRAYGTASARKHDVLVARGATPIDYRDQDFVAVLREAEPDGVDVVYDSVGGDNLTRSAVITKKQGRIVSFGATAHSSGWLDFVRAQIPVACIKANPFGPSLGIYAITVSRGCGWQACRDDWQALLDLAANGELSPLVGATVPLEEAARAHQLMEDGAVAGKIVLTVT
ncbi:MAG: alcohol dehydrogenase [Deltaproteobacteria bacterium]|nr:MAG: alcohol dehydrogenase [Deltaproteobacteria bacterium]